MPRSYLLIFVSVLVLFVISLIHAPAPALAIEPLATTQKEQLDDSVTDLTPDLDGPGLYPLLTDADTWDAKDQSGAMIPDYDAILAKPRDSRGNLYFIEGIFAGLPRDDDGKFRRMIRPGTWEGRLERWTVITNREADKIVIVLLTHPPKEHPEAGAALRLAARFYKVWSYTDLNNKPRAALVFVGAFVQVGENTISPVGEFQASRQLPAFALAVVIIGLCVVMLIIRKRITKKFAQREPKDFRTGADKDKREDEFNDPNAPPLPQDPIEALAELERRRSAAKDEEALKK